MLTKQAASIATSYWASHLGCSPKELFSAPFRTLTHGGELTGYCGAFALFRSESVVLSIPPERADTLQASIAGLRDGCTPGRFASSFESIATAIIGPAYIGYAIEVPEPMHTARDLGLNDADALSIFQQSCDSTEWEHGGSSSEYPSSGIFIDQQLVSLAGYEVWGQDIAHISVITHPGFRGHGFGRSAVAHLARRVIRNGLLPQYRTLESNRASIRIAESLGFQPYATSVAIRF